MMVLLTECIVCNPHLSHRRNCSQRVQIWEALWRVCQTVDPGVGIIAIIIIITRPPAALQTAGLDWIVGPGYSSGRTFWGIPNISLCASSVLLGLEIVDKQTDRRRVHQYYKYIIIIIFIR